MKYYFQEFVQTKKTSSPIGEGNEYEWQIIDGEFDNLTNAIDYIRNGTTLLTVRIMDRATDEPVWCNHS